MVPLQIFAGGDWRMRRTAFAIVVAGLADQADGLSFFNVEVDAVQCIDVCVVRVILDDKVSDLKDVLRHSTHLNS